MTDLPYGPVPDPTGASDLPALGERLKALQQWAGRPTRAQLHVQGATDSIDSFVAACLRHRHWSAVDINREVARWSEAAARVSTPPLGSEPGSPGQSAPAREAALAAIIARISDEEQPAPATPEDLATATTVVLPVLREPAAAPAPGQVGGSRPTRSRRPRWCRPARRWLAVSATVVVTLLAISVPVLVLQTGDDPTRVANLTGPASPTPSLPSPTPPPSASQSPTSAAEPERGFGRGMRPATPTPPAAPDAAAPAPAQPPPAPPRSPRPDQPPAPPPADSTPPTTAPAGPPRNWSTVVDNTSRRFSASSSWRTSSNSRQHYGSNYRYANPVEASDPAWYRVNLPATGRYRVEVRYPAKSTHNDRTPYIVATTNGHRTIHVNQQTNGGRWVSLGTFTLARGDANVVAVSRWRVGGTGHVVADAIRITRL